MHAPSVELRPWQRSDDSIGWQWINANWHYLASDGVPRDQEMFFALKRSLGATLIGVWRDDDLGGLLIHEKVSPEICIAHCVFSKRFSDGITTVEALEQGKELCWASGIHVIWCLIPEDHRAMRILVKKVGAIYEGILRERFVRDGRWQNWASYSIIAPD